MGRRLLGKRVLVTGAARGLGASAALGLAEAGAECILLDRSRDELQATVETAASRGPGPFHALVCDLADRESTLDAAARAKEIARGDLTALVHCAAVLHLRSVEETTDAQWDEMLAVNLRSAFLLVRELMPELRAESGGSILLTSSRAGIMGFPREGAYCATKFGIEGLAKALAEECGDSRNPCQHDYSGGAAHQTNRAFPRRGSCPSRGRTDLGILGGARPRVRGLRPPPRRQTRGTQRAPFRGRPGGGHGAGPGPSASRRRVGGT